MPVRPGRWRLPDLTINPDGAGNDIFAPGCAPMPVVLAPRRIPRPQIRPQAGLAVPRSGLGPRAEDCHKLDPRRWPEHPISTLLHDGRGRRQEGQGHLRPPVSEVVERYGKRAKKRYKTFEATWRPADGLIRVVLVDEPGAWVAFFCTD